VLVGRPKQRTFFVQKLQIVSSIGNNIKSEHLAHFSWVWCEKDSKKSFPLVSEKKKLITSELGAKGNSEIKLDRGGNLILSSLPVSLVRVVTHYY